MLSQYLSSCLDALRKVSSKRESQQCLALKDGPAASHASPLTLWENKMLQNDPAADHPYAHADWPMYLQRKKSDLKLRRVLSSIPMIKVSWKC